MLGRIINVINTLLDKDIMPWLKQKALPLRDEQTLATHIIGDRLCGSLSDPIIRNEQERRQIYNISTFLESLGYHFIKSGDIKDFKQMPPGTFSYHLNVPVNISESQKINMPIDVAIKRRCTDKSELPVLIECKSAGDFANTNKRRKEEAMKISQLRNTYGDKIEFILFLCGYFDGAYLGYEAAEGIDWVWEHRIEDFHLANL